MKVEVTVIAEFPGGIPYGVIERLAEENGHAAVMQNATVTRGLIQKPDGVMPRRIIRWKSDGVDIQDTTSEDVFKAQARAAAEQGIKLVRRIKKLDQDRCPEVSRNETVFWTWGDEFKQSGFPLGKT